MPLRLTKNLFRLSLIRMRAVEAFFYEVRHCSSPPKKPLPLQKQHSKLQIVTQTALNLALD